MKAGIGPAPGRHKADARMDPFDKDPSVRYGVAEGSRRPCAG